MLQFLQSMSPEQQAAAVGLAVAGLVYLARHLEPNWFESEGEVAKFQRTASVVLLAGLGVLIRTLSSGGWGGAGAFVLAWALAYASAEGAHTLVSRTAALGE